LQSRGLLVLGVVLAMFVVAWLTWRGFSSRDFSTRPQLGKALAPEINKQPVAFANHTFDPAAPPPDMPPLANGEIALCDSNFVSNANIGGESRRSDATHATVTIAKVAVTLQLIINIWVPIDATHHVIEHEQGHRQISEYYYQTADTLAQRIAAKYLGRRVEITGADLNAESSKMLEQLAREFTHEYNQELNPGPTQLLYDDITDHGRNDVVVQDAVAHAIKNVTIESPQPTTSPAN
jgi:hypothetical protein